jgi:hypothetical protein
VKSFRKQVIRDLEDKMEDRHERSSEAVEDRARARILQYGLVETGLMLGEVTSFADKDGFSVGIPPMEPDYPTYLHQGFRHWRSGELIGPYPYLTDAINDSRGRMKQIYEG